MVLYYFKTSKACFVGNRKISIQTMTECIDGFWTRLSVIDNMFIQMFIQRSPTFYFFSFTFYMPRHFFVNFNLNALSVQQAAYSGGRGFDGRPMPFEHSRNDARQQ